MTGKLVLGESLADLGGLTVAYDAFQKSLEGKPRPADIDGFTPEQCFFLGWAAGLSYDLHAAGRALAGAEWPTPDLALPRQRPRSPTCPPSPLRSAANRATR